MLSPVVEKVVFVFESFRALDMAPTWAVPGLFFFRTTQKTPWKTAGDSRINSILLATSVSLRNLLVLDLKNPKAVILVCKHDSNLNRVPFFDT